MTYYIAEIRLNLKSEKPKKERKMKKRLVNPLTAMLFALLLGSTLIMLVPATGVSDLSDVIESLEDLQNHVIELPKGADGFENPRNVTDKRKTLCNKIGAVIHKVEAGNYKGAIKKLKNDVENSIIDWFVPPYRNDLIEKVEDIIKRIPRVHDVAVTGVSAPAEVTQGDIVTINVDVANLGRLGRPHDETFYILVSYDTTPIGTESVTLSPKDSKTIPFIWNTDGIPPNTYTLTAEAVLPKDEDLTNNKANTTITIKEEVGLVHDVAVTGVSAPAEATKGTVVTVSVNVANPGDYDETFDLTVTYATNLIGTKSVTLAAGDSTSVPLNWDTSDVTPTTYTITAKAILAQDNDPNNNEAITSIIIGKLSSLITCFVSPDTLYSGDNVTISGDIDPDLEGVTVTLMFTKPDGSSEQRPTTSNSTGGYSIEYTPDMVGNWTVTASWPGDEDHEGATSDPATFTEEEPVGWPLAWLAGIALAVAALTGTAIYALYRRRKKKSVEGPTSPENKPVVSF